MAPFGREGDERLETATKKPAPQPGFQVQMQVLSFYVIKMPHNPIVA
ncbi:MAG: hypothetical protein HOH43_27010 [Candidatus Latescibacteria bacterium]|jgi:hypothetical protein|nr:hypothetical protein [Candidatus Latescibacterota bacterium]